MKHDMKTMGSPQLDKESILFESFKCVTGQNGICTKDVVMHLQHVRDIRRVIKKLVDCLYKIKTP